VRRRGHVTRQHAAGTERPHTAATPARRAARPPGSRTGAAGVGEAQRQRRPPRQRPGRGLQPEAAAPAARQQRPQRRHLAPQPPGWVTAGSLRWGCRAACCPAPGAGTASARGPGSSHSSATEANGTEEEVWDPEVACIHQARNHTPQRAMECAKKERQRDVGARP